jgi:hypothetical protein
MSSAEGLDQGEAAMQTMDVNDDGKISSKEFASHFHEFWADLFAEDNEAE